MRERSLPDGGWQGADGPVGPDGLAQPVEFRVPRWFVIVIATAVIMSIGLALVVLT